MKAKIFFFILNNFWPASYIHDNGASVEKRNISDKFLAFISTCSFRSAFYVTLLLASLLNFDKTDDCILINF